MKQIPPTRTERDSLGEMQVPATVYYGIQTMRAIENFPISGTTLATFPDLIRALAYVKKASASANRAGGSLTSEKAETIIRVCDELIAGQWYDQFPVDMFQGGAGTSTNMNVNEVIANRGLELMGHSRGNYSALHPNNDVNLSQSTNDVYPTAIRLALLFATPKLIEALELLADAFAARGLAFTDILKLGRTQLQDAVPMTLGQEFHAFAVTIREDIQRVSEAMNLVREVNLGGTAIGTGITASADHQSLALTALTEMSGVHLVAAANLVEACWDTGGFVHFSGVLKRVAVKLSKIANDLRLLSSGPRGGIGEIRLPAAQPGSSIMPGKVNPVIPEVVNQVAFYVIGADVSITMAAEGGQLQLNAFEPLIAYSLLQSIRLLSNASDTLALRCVAGIESDEEVCKRHLEAGTALATALVPVLGYERSAELAKKILAGGQTLRELLVDDLSPEMIDKVLDARAMTQPAAATRVP